MPNTPSTAPPAATRPAPRRFQFSLARLMVIITIAAIFLGISTTVLGSIIAEFFGWLVWYIVPAALLSVAVFGRGDLKAFAMGGLIPWIGPLCNWPAGRHLEGVAFFLLITGLACGIVATATRRWILARAPR